MERSERPQEGRTEAAPEGASEAARPEHDQDRPLREEGAQREPAAEQQHPESGPASPDE